MNRHFLSKLKERAQPALDASSGTGALSEDEHRTIHALICALAADPDWPAERTRLFVDDLTSRRPGYLRELQDGCRMLDETTARQRPGRRFHELLSDERDTALRSLLRRYPHPWRESVLRRRLRLTSENLDVLLAPRRTRRFRLFVVRELLGHYYASEAGWSVVGYKSFPGRSLAEVERCEVRAIRVEADEIVLELSDGSFEALAPATLRVEDDDRLSVAIKGGRQRALFSRDAYLVLAERIEESDAGLVLRIGSRTYEVTA